MKRFASTPTIALLEGGFWLNVSVSRERTANTTHVMIFSRFICILVFTD